MNRLFTNGLAKDFVLNPYRRMVNGSGVIWIAAPYVTQTNELLDAQKAGKEIQLIVGLNECTSPKALRLIHGLPGLNIRFFTRRFHAKLYIFDDVALLGSSNLTQGGMESNREATFQIDEEEDLISLRRFFSELWSDAAQLTPDKLNRFEQAWSGKRATQDADPLIEKAVDKSEPKNIAVSSWKRRGMSAFVEGLRRQIADYGTAFNEVNSVLANYAISRQELSGLEVSYQTNRFLNWVRLTQAPKEEWRDAPKRPVADRIGLIKHLGAQWMTLEHDRSQISDEYREWLTNVTEAFHSKEAILSTSKEKLTIGLLSIHAFNEQHRWKSERLEFGRIFWQENNEDEEQVRKSLAGLLFGPGEFPDRLGDYLEDENKKFAYFGKFCAIELFGTIKPQQCPPMNGRTAKALRFLGFSVAGQ